MTVTAPDPVAPAATGPAAPDALVWILASDEPWARHVALSRILRLPPHDPARREAHAAVVAHPLVAGLVDALPTWGGELSADHHSPLFLPNRLNLLADLGVGGGDFERIETLLDELTAERDRRGRFRAPVGTPARPKPDAGSLTCDANVVTDVLLRFGRTDDPIVTRALKRLVADADVTPQGRGWRCVPERPALLGGPKRPDACPQVTLEGLRALSHLDATRRPAWATEAARTPLEFWRRRGDERPYAFGHGFQFKTVRWPSFWYDALWVLDTVGRFPQLWEGPAAREEDRSSIAEIAACLLAYNVGADGTVTPQRCYPGFEAFSFGSKDAPSAWATARVLAALAPFDALAEKIAAVDVEALPGSLGGSGRAVSPGADLLGRPVKPPTCPVPLKRPGYPAERILPRVLQRHHLDRDWEPASAESVVSDVVGLFAGDPTTPYLSLAARLPGFDPEQLNAALDERRSLVRFRCMRGVLYVVRRDFVATVHAASTKQVVRYARAFAEHRGVDAATYAALSARILNETAATPLTIRELRERLRPHADLAAIVTLMCAEGRLLRAGAEGGRFSRRTTYAPFEVLLPDVVLGRIDAREASAQVLRAYVRAFGPVTPRDAAWWTGMDLKRVGRALNRLEDELVEISIADRDGTWLMHVADAEELERARLIERPNVAALPAMDPLLVGYTDRSRFVDDASRAYAFDAAGHCAPLLLLDGAVAGVWDVDCGEDPHVRVHFTREIDPDSRKALIAAASAQGSLRLGVEDSRVEVFARMTPLSERPVGAYAHPLR